MRKQPITVKRFIMLVALAALVALVRSYLPAGEEKPALESGHAPGSLSVEEAARRQLSGIMLSVTGRVQRTLADDNEGSRHQRFILETESGHTVLVAHNIDLAPRVPLSAGDRLEIHGQFEWNDRGGVIHWTHHDPNGRHEEGWIKHKGKTYARTFDPGACFTRKEFVVSPACT